MLRNVTICLNSLDSAMHHAAAFHVKIAVVDFSPIVPGTDQAKFTGRRSGRRAVLSKLQRHLTRQL
jgi:hypothetical protein